MCYFQMIHSDELIPLTHQGVLLQPQQPPLSWSDDKVCSLLDQLGTALVFKSIRLSVRHIIIF